MLLIGYSILLVANVIATVTPVHLSHYTSEENLNDPLPDELSYRLPNNTKPISYHLILNTDIHRNIFEFDGQLKILILTSKNAGENITLHQRQLTISKIKLDKYEENGTVHNIPLQDEWYFIKEREFLVIPVRGGLENETRYKLSINYNGTLRSDMGGFYRSSYIDASGNERWLATTQFETTNARHGFPCYDEPALKANYQLEIIHGANYTAISNMPLLEPPESTGEQGKVQSIFQTTVPTSTYLIAFVISDFSYTTNVNQSNSGDKFPHRVWSKPTHVNETYQALDAGEKILAALTKYLNVPYSLPKMDQIAVPDFAPGAMENWGLVTYKESYLLWNDSVSTYTSKTGLASVIAHEFGHQWFGNLVSPRWWTYLWLSEGFATLFSFIGTNLVYPDWHYMDLMVLNSMQLIFPSDESINAASMTDYIPNPDAMSPAFSQVSYNKAGCVLRMFMNAFTERSFKKGLTYYLNERAFKDAAEEDLFDALEKAVKEDRTLAPLFNVADLMKSWTRQKGFPLLKIDRNYTHGTIDVTQSRYLANHSIEDYTRWWIPYNFITANDRITKSPSTFANYWLPENTTTHRIFPSNNQNWTASDWVVFNKNHTGYYRILYDERNYNLIAEGLQSSNFKRIPLLSRAQIIDDSFSFAKTGRLTYETALNLTAYLHQEKEYSPWGTAIRGLSTINRIFAANESYSKYEDFINRITDPILKFIGVDDLPIEPHQHKYLRSALINTGCSTGNKRCLNLANAKVQKILRDGGEIHQNVRAAVYCGGLRIANRDTYYSVWKRVNESNSDTYRYTLISSLACTWNKQLLAEFLNSSLNSTNQHAIEYNAEEQQNIILSVSINGQMGLEMAINFLTDNVDEVNRTLTKNLLNEIVTEMSHRIVSENMFEKFKSIGETMVRKDYIEQETLELSLKSCKENFQWLELHSDSIYNWVNANHNGANYFHLSILTLLFTIWQILSIGFN